MRAKPIIDMDVICPTGDVASVIEDISRLGYVHRGDLGIPTREAFDYVGADELPQHHLYACEATSPELRRHTAFRDFLRSHPDWAQQLSDLKVALDSRPGMTRDEYQELKSPLVEEIVGLALAKLG